MSETPQAHAGFGTGLSSALFPGKTTATVVIGAPYQDANADDKPHLEMGQIEIPQ
jgi:hypothetical protein